MDRLRDALASTVAEPGSNVCLNVQDSLQFRDLSRVYATANPLGAVLNGHSYDRIVVSLRLVHKALYCIVKGERIWRGTLSKIAAPLIGW